MITTLTTPFIDRKYQFLAWATEQESTSYQELLSKALELIREAEPWPELDISRITVINDGDYQGTLVFVIPEEGYQPWRYFVTKVSYGSCSGCDTLEAAQGMPQQLYDITLHMIQGLKEI